MNYDASHGIKPHARSAQTSSFCVGKLGAMIGIQPGAATVYSEDFTTEMRRRTGRASRLQALCYDAGAQILVYERIECNTTSSILRVAKCTAYISFGGVSAEPPSFFQFQLPSPGTPYTNRSILTSRRLSHCFSLGILLFLIIPSHPQPPLSLLLHRIPLHMHHTTICMYSNSEPSPVR